MIRLNRPPCPNPDALIRDYRNTINKAALVAASHGKCMYCESRVTHVYFGDIEHIKPKSKFPALEFEWVNLGFVCARCNNSKRDEWSDETPTLDPYSEEPADHIAAIGPALMHVAGSERGEMTISVVGLNRPELVERRRERISLIHALIDRAARTANPVLRDALFYQLHIETHEASEYALISRTAKRLLLPDQQ